MRGAQDTGQHAALVAFHLQLLLLPPVGSDGHILQNLERVFQARPERRISAVKQSLPILIETDPI